jgi:hypothetical protein
MIKVNQITSAAQAARLQKRVDLGGICVSKRKDATAPYISLDAAVALKTQVPELPLAVSQRPDESFSTSELSDLLDAVDAKFFEFTPIDYAKTDQFRAQMLELAGLRRPKIANGFFIQQDDCGFISETGPFDRMREIGVEFFQFEIESAVDDSFRIRPKDLADADAFFRRFPTLVTDKVRKTAGYPLKSVAGFFFNIAASRDATNYDWSRTSLSEADITRILMAR